MRLEVGGWELLAGAPGQVRYSETCQLEGQLREAIDRLAAILLDSADAMPWSVSQLPTQPPPDAEQVLCSLNGSLANAVRAVAWLGRQSLQRSKTEQFKQQLDRLTEPQSKLRHQLAALSSPETEHQPNPNEFLAEAFEVWPAGSPCLGWCWQLDSNSRSKSERDLLQEPLPQGREEVRSWAQLRCLLAGLQIIQWRDQLIKSHADAVKVDCNAQHCLSWLASGWSVVIRRLWPMCRAATCR